MKSVLFVASFPPPFTGEAVCTRLYYALAGRQSKVDAVNISHGSGVPRKTGSFAWSRFRQIFGSHSEVRKKIAAQPYDILYFVPGATPLGQIKDWLLLLPLSKNRIGEIVAHIHNGNFAKVLRRPLLGMISRLIFRRIDRFILLNQAASRELSPSLPGHKLHVVPNTIDEAMLFTEEAVASRIEERLGRSVWQIYYISNMIREKGYPELAEAAAILARTPTFSFHLHYIGGWPAHASIEEFRQKLQELKLESHVTIHGPIQDRDILRTHLEKADILALPTYYPREAQPMCLLEAANAGVPLVSTRHAGIPEIVEEGYNGFLVQPRDPASLAEAIRKVCSEGAWRTLAENSRRLFLERYSPATNAAAFRKGLYGLD